MNLMPGGSNSNSNRQGFYEDSASRSSSYTHAGDPPPQDDTPSSEDQNSFFRRGGGGGEGASIQKEHMFDKVVTPSDVGKLNRLVIPKQHAERYFPLDSSANEKGLLLNFEDRNGKPWRFRYSYWNSSQSYVMTKGWSRFVKEKKLDAGDIVSFQRGLGDLLKDRLFIDWRRRPDAPPDLLPIGLHHHHFSSAAFHYRPPPPSSANPWGTFLVQQPPSRDSSNYPYSHFLQPHNYNNSHQYQYHPYGGAIVNGNPCPRGSIMYLRGGAGGGGGVLTGPPQMPVQHTMDHQMVFESVPVVQGKAAAKRLRLFGVNMDCPVSADDSDNINECDVLVMSSPSATTMMPSQYHPPFDSSSSSSSSSSLARLRHNDGTHDKGKGSMSLDLDI